MAHVAKLTSLECLDLFGARISDAGCASLGCGQPGVPPAAVAAQGQPCQGQGQGMSRTRALPLALLLIALPSPPANPAICSKLTNLRRLEVCGGGVTDAGVASLAALPKLQHLSLAQVRWR